MLVILGDAERKSFDSETFYHFILNIFVKFLKSILNTFDNLTKKRIRLVFFKNR